MFVGLQSASVVNFSLVSDLSTRFRPAKPVTRDGVRPIVICVDVMRHRSYGPHHHLTKLDWCLQALNSADDEAAVWLSPDCMRQQQMHQNQVLVFFERLTH